MWNTVGIVLGARSNVITVGYGSLFAARLLDPTVCQAGGLGRESIFVAAA